MPDLSPAAALGRSDVRWRFRPQFLRLDRTPLQEVSATFDVPNRDSAVAIASEDTPDPAAVAGLDRSNELHAERRRHPFGDLHGIDRTLGESVVRDDGPPRNANGVRCVPRYPRRRHEQVLLTGDLKHKRARGRGPPSHS